MFIAKLKDEINLMMYFLFHIYKAFNQLWSRFEWKFLFSQAKRLVKNFFMTCKIGKRNFKECGKHIASRTKKPYEFFLFFLHFFFNMHEKNINSNSSKTENENGEIYPHKKLFKLSLLLYHRAWVWSKNLWHFVKNFILLLTDVAENCSIFYLFFYYYEFF